MMGRITNTPEKEEFAQSEVANFEKIYMARLSPIQNFCYPRVPVLRVTLEYGPIL